jgi:hypothetical protein
MAHPALFRSWRRVSATSIVCPLQGSLMLCSTQDRQRDEVTSASISNYSIQYESSTQPKGGIHMVWL